MENNFNSVAPFYDRLKKWIFSDSLNTLEQSVLDRAGHVETALIIGGGSGEIIPNVVNICKGKIDFVEKSEKMIEMARRRTGSESITFHICDIQDFELEQYDLIITNFVLDVFDKEELDKQIRRLSTCLNQDGIGPTSTFRNRERSGTGSCFG